MTLDDKLGQMIIPTYSASSADRLVTGQHVGGFIFNGNDNTAAGLLAATTHLQQITSVPLIFAIDCEAGLGARVVDATRFPLNMSAGAACAPDLLRMQGRVTARECRAVGIHIGFGPVVDVLTEPVNPIIGVRAYSDDPALVARLAEAYVHGANSEGLLCTFKHFPGHGATTGDSHNSLPVVDIARSDLEGIHVAPYRLLLSRGLGDLVMSAHVWYTCLDPGTTAWPATLSSNALTGILRNELGYDGAIISDSFGMAGLLAAANTYDAARIGVQAGLDIILMPTSEADALSGLRDAVNSGAIPIGRIDQSVRRILRLKSRVGLPAGAIVPVSVMQATVGHPDHRRVAAAIARRAIAGARPAEGEFPTSASQRVLCLSLDASSSIFYLYDASYFLNEFAWAHSNVTTQTVATNVTSAQRSQIVASAAQYERIIVISRDWKPTISTAQQQLVQALIDSGRPLAYCSFGSPYHINMFTGMKNFLCGFSSHYAVQMQMADVLAGGAPLSGNWPVAMPDGIVVPPSRALFPTAQAGVGDWGAYDGPMCR
jgi:beta-N-acetylhexosaminidase